MKKNSFVMVVTMMIVVFSIVFICNLALGYIMKFCFSVLTTEDIYYQSLGIGIGAAIVTKTLHDLSKF